MDDIEGTEPYPGYWDDVAAADAAYVPRDPVDEVTDVATLIALHTAEQYLSVAALRRDAIAKAKSHPSAAPHALPGEMVHRSLRLELSAALRITEYAAGELLARAAALTERYPQALDALRAARITDQHVRVLVDLLGEVGDDLAAALVDDAVRLAEELGVGEFRRALRTVIESATAPTLSERHTRALTDRRVWVDPAADGMAYLGAFLPAVEAHAIFDRLTRMGKAITGRGADTTAPGDDDRTLGQARADLLADLLIDGACDRHAPAVRGIRSTVVVTVPALSLLDDDHAAREPATVEGIGPIPIDTARELCGAAASWMRVLTHPETGAVLSVGRDRYEPPPELKRLVRWRAERCMAPGCLMPASRCEIDHNEPWCDGGHTSLDNHCPLCSGHHHVKHDGGWTVEQVPGSGGVIQWTSPYGRRYLVEPERRVPMFHAESRPDSTPAPF